MPKKCTVNHKSPTCRKDRSSTKSSQRRSCSAVNPSDFCSSREKRSEYRKKSSQIKRRECCCGVPKKKCEKRSEQPVKGTQTHRSVPEERITLDDIRPCYCREAGIEPVRKKTRKSGSSLLCCSCFKKFWKKRSDKKKSSRTAPCKRYLCLHNPGRSELDEPVPCVKCTHNCKARSPARVGKGNRKKSLAAGSAVGGCSDPSPKTHVQISKSEENIPEDLDATEPAPESEERGVDGNRNKHEQSSLENIPDERSDRAREKSRRKEKKVCKKVKRRKKSKRGDRTIPSEDDCCPCEILEEEVELKAKPCMKCPKKMMRDKTCRKLTFASCAELRDYKIRNKCHHATGIKNKKRTLMGVLFDVIFWPYVFWPR